MSVLLDACHAKQDCAGKQTSTNLSALPAEVAASVTISQAALSPLWSAEAECCRQHSTGGAALTDEADCP